MESHTEQKTPSDDGRRRGRAPTIRDVARLAGVSPQTVSRVNNAHPAVEAATRRRVELAIQQLRYRPSNTARALARRRTMTLGVVSVGTSQYGPSVTLLGIVEAARHAGYATRLISLGDIDAEAMRAAINQLGPDAVDGVVVIAPLPAAALAAERVSADVPVVLFEPGAHNGTTIVAVDEVLGARLATRHLLDLGHETVWHVSGPSGWLGTDARIQGWQAELTAAGRVAHDVVIGDWSSMSGYRAGQELARHRDVTAVFVANDQMALGVLKALEEAAIAVPRHISVVGFDDIPECAFFSPSLTTVRLDFAEVGRRCAQRVLGLLRGEPLEPTPAVVPELVLRASTGAPPR
jgi:DNA-binding LacI/PurR family transcriptional regulator